MAALTATAISTVLKVNETSEWIIVAIRRSRETTATSDTVALVPAALQQCGMAGVRYVPLSQKEAALPRYETRCLWSAARDQPALGLFLDAVRTVAQAG